LEFGGSIKQEWLMEDTDKVHKKGITLFTEIANCLKTVKFDGSNPNRGSKREFSEKVDPDRAAFNLLSLNRLMWDLLIESVVWGQRLKSLRSPEKVVQEYSYSKVEGIAGREVASIGNFREDGNVNGDTHVKFMSETSVKVNEISIKEIPISGSPIECNEQGDPSKTFDIPSNVKIQTVDGLGSKRYSNPKLESSSNVSTQFPSANGHLQVHQNFPVAINIKHVRPIADSKVLNQSASMHSPVSILQDSDEGFWKPFSDIRKIGISRCMNWDAKVGKSKSFFAKTLDERFIIKEVKKTELEAFLGFSSLYFKHMRESFESGSQTCLAKVLGIYRFTRRHIKSGKEVKHDLMVMENLTYNRNIVRQYDLKGALFERYTSDAIGAEDVLLDQNFVEDMNSSPLYVSHKAKRVLQRAIWNDTSFLNSINVMDYSLLMGVDSQKRELVCGIIYYLKKYTWDKHLETWMKASLVVPKNHMPTVISPKEYKKRFRKFMSTYFFSVPDHWCSQKSPIPCKLCCSGKEDPFQMVSLPKSF
ncbi:hypothetical protein RYX36_001680, partial [Vicia faba]